MMMMDMAGYFVQRMREIHPSGTVRLAGYSFGACVAVEMALQLQQQDASGSVQSLILLDGSHSFVAAYTDRTRQRLALVRESAATEAGVICAFVSQFAFRLAPSEEVCCSLIVGLNLWFVRRSVTCLNSNGGENRNDKNRHWKVGLDEKFRRN